MHSRKAIPPPPKGTSPDISTPWLRLSAALWAARAAHSPTLPRRSPMARQRSPPGGGVLSALGGGLAASSRLADGGARHGWQRRGPRVYRADDPCRLERSRPAAGLAGAPRPEGPLSRRPP